MPPAFVADLRSGLDRAARGAYALALRGRYGRRGMPWRVHDQTVRIDPRVRRFVPHESECALYDFLRSHVTPGSQVLDVGAFLGIYAILESRLAGPRGRVVTLEPTAWSASVARRHIGYNAGPGAPIALIEAAAGESRGKATLHEYDEPYVNALGTAVDVTGTPRLRAVDVVTIDDVCSEHRLEPSFIRMDVQGAEWHALRGARETIRAAGSDLVIVAEMHPQCWPGFGVDALTAMDTIRSLGLRAEPLEPGTDLFARDGHVIFTPRAEPLQRLM
jgi:FkbM family methyltransferase